MINLDDSPPARRTVLVVDDDDDIRDSVCDLLSEHGYEVQAARDGSEAFDALANMQRLPDAVLLDLMMPVMNGWEVLEVLKADNKLAEIPVIIVTAHTNAHVPEADALVHKPFSAERLLATLGEQCD